MGAAKMLWTYSSFRCSLVQPSRGPCTGGGRRGGGGREGRVRLAQAGAGCLEATSIFNLILGALLIQRGSARRRIEATSWGNPPSPSLLFSPLLLDLRRAIPLFSPSPPGRLLCNGVRLSGWPRLRALSEGIYIRPNHIKQRLGVFTAHCKKEKKKEGVKKLFQDEQDLQLA